MCQTDRHTDRQTTHDGIDCACIASRGKNTHTHTEDDIYDKTHTSVAFVV